MIKTEFHIHTKYSKDSLLLGLFIGIICKIKKIKCIAITDHNEIDGAVKYKQSLKKYGVSVIVGEEIFSKDGEIIGLFLKKRINPGLSATETIMQIKKQGGIVYIPHPYEPYRYKTVLREECINKNKNNIDLIEVHNGRNRNLEISKKQKELSDKYKIRPIIGSDAHTFFEIGRNTILLNSINKREILDSIEKGVILTQKKAHFFAHIWTKIAKFIKMLLKGDFDGIYRAIFKRSRREK